MFVRLVTQLSSLLIVMLGAATGVFLLLHVVPGDPVEVMLGESAAPMDRAALRARLGLDDPLWKQWTHYMNGLLHGDLGVSIHTQQPVTTLLAERFPATLALGALALAIAVMIGLAGGIVSAACHGTLWDHALRALTTLGISLPNFWLGPLLVLLFAVTLGWLPVSGRESATGIVLPALTLGLGMGAMLARMVRAMILEALGEDYIRTARAKGLAHWRVVIRHALPNALLPVVTLLGLQVGAVLSGAVITETIFSWPGMGSLIIEAIQRRDYPVVQGAVLIISGLYVTINALTDLLYVRLDPRVRIT